MIEIKHGRRPGVRGYRTHGCRCYDCVSMYRDYKEVGNIRYKERRRAAGLVVREPELPPVDWSEVEHVMVGAGVRRRG